MFNNLYRKVFCTFYKPFKFQNENIRHVSMGRTYYGHVIAAMFQILIIKTKLLFTVSFMFIYRIIKTEKKCGKVLVILKVYQKTFSRPDIIFVYFCKRNMKKFKLYAKIIINKNLSRPNQKNG